MALPQIHVYDENRQRIGVIDDAEELEWVRRWRGMDEWTLRINAHKSSADLLVEEGYIGYYIQGQYRFGLCEYPKLTTGYVVTGKGLLELTVINSPFSSKKALIL